MKKAKILIKGQIGTSYNEDGTVNVKGVELQDVVSQVEEAKEANSEIEGYSVFINSLGGSVEVGKAIAKYVGSLENAFTIADTHCASMGTEIHLSVPKENRSIIKGSLYSIHNPWVGGVSGNASELEEVADLIKEKEKAMVKMYTKATGLDKEAVQGLMNQETSLTDEECKTMGFVSEIIPAELKAVAFFDKPKQKPEITMSGIKKIITDVFASFKTDLNIKSEHEELKTTEIVTAQGKLEVVHVGEKIAKGDSVTLEGESAPVGNYELDDKSVIKINAKGKISEIVAAPPEKEETPEEAVARLTEELKLSKGSVETMEADFKKQLGESMKALKKEIGSDYTPPKAQAKFGKQKPIEEGAHVGSVDRKKSYTTHAR